MEKRFAALQKKGTARLLVCAALILMLLGLNACSANVNRAELIEQGETVFQENCAACHQQDGSGAEGIPALAGNPVVTLHNTSPLVSVVSDGRGGMPAFRDTLSGTEIAAVLTYIRSAWGNNASAVPPKQAR